MRSEKQDGTKRFLKICLHISECSDTGAINAVQRGKIMLVTTVSSLA